VLLTDVDDHTGRPAGLALRYGVLPLVPEAGADADYLVDYDSASGTGCAPLVGHGRHARGARAAARSRRRRRYLITSVIRTPSSSSRATSSPWAQARPPTRSTT